MIIHTLFPSWYLVENPSMIISSKRNGENNHRWTMDSFLTNKVFITLSMFYWDGRVEVPRSILYLKIFFINWDYLLFKSRINKGIVGNYLLVFKHYMSSSNVDQIQDCTVSFFLCFKCDTLHTLQSMCFNSRRFFKISSSCSSFPIIWRFHQEFLPEASF